MIVVLIFVLVLVCAFRLSTYITYGSLIKDEEWVPILEKQSQKGSALNMFDSSIINIGALPYITSISFDILVKYYISNVGAVPRWSKSHKIIKAEFKKIKEEQFNKYK
jgi:preprotein translocase subunit SecY